MLNFEKNSKIAKLAKFGDPYLDLGKEIAKSRRQKVFNFNHEQKAVRIIYLAIYTPFSHILQQIRHYLKNSKIWRAPWEPLLGIVPGDFASLWDS